MPPKAGSKIPSLRLHKRTGQAVVTLVNPRGGRRDYYLGRHGSDAAQEAHQQLVARWIAGGREHPNVRVPTPDEIQPGTLQELIHRDCHSTGKQRPRSATQKTLSRSYINATVRRVKQLFKWAESRELVPAATWHRLATVENLKAGRSGARESKGLAAVALPDVQATCTHLNRQVADLVWFCWHTGARMGEAVQLASRHVDMSQEIWLFRPPQHKNAHRGKARTIPVGKAAQNVLRGFVTLQPDRMWFRPCDAVNELHAARSEARETPRWPSHVARNEAKRTAEPRRTAGEAYTTNAVQVAIRRACRAAKVDCWTPHMLRHAALTRIRGELGLEAAAAVGGHWTLDVTEAYTAATKEKLAIEVMRKLG